MTVRTNLPNGGVTHMMIDTLAEEIDMLERHLRILQLVIDNKPIGIVKISNYTDHPHHKVRYSFRVLEGMHLIEPSDQGAITTIHTNEFVDNFNRKIDVLLMKLDNMKIES